MNSPKLKYNHSEEHDDLSKPNLLPYGISPSAPAISLPDVDLFKKDKAVGARNHFQAMHDELRKKYEEFVMKVTINDIIYRSVYNFVPVVGQTYYLYRIADDDYLLSLIEPERWGKYEFLGAYKCNSDGVWGQA